MGAPADIVAEYGRAKGWSLGRRTILVEGTTDERLIGLARRLELKATGVDLYAHGLAVVAAGEGERGGAKGVVRELHVLRSMAGTCLTRDGRAKYRFVGVLDNDDAGRRSVARARDWDASIREYRDVFRLRPVMPRGGSLEPRELERRFCVANGGYATLDWELEDLIDDGLVGHFVVDEPDAVREKTRVGERTHRKFTWEGKAKLHRYVEDYAIRDDLAMVIDVMRSMRYYLQLPVDGNR